MRSSGRSGKLWLAAGLSPLLHLLAAGAIVSLDALPSGEPPGDARREFLLPPEPPAEPDEQVRLGIERSNTATITWIGFETPSEHEAREAETEQSALTRDAPSPPVQIPEINTPQNPPSPETLAQAQAEPPPRPEQPVLAETPTREAPVLAEAQTVMSEAAAAEAPPAPPVIGLAADEPDGVVVPRALELAKRLLPLLAEAAAMAEEDAGAVETAAPQTPPHPQTRPSQTESPQPAEAPPTPTPRQIPSPAPPKPDAIQSERESDATALRRPVSVRPGRVVAAEGLEIQTRRVELTTYTQVLTGSVRVRVLATFDRQGRVIKVELVKPSGVAGVDEPVRNSVYAWRAKGRALEQIPANNPDAGLTIPFEIVVR